MAFLFTVALLAVLFAVVASLSQEGLWSNAITLVNLVTSALLATNFFELLSKFFLDNVPSAEYFADFLSIWLLFAVLMALFSTATQQVSKVRVKFVKQLDIAGGWLLAFAAAWVTLCFLTMTLHMAPLARDFMWGGFVAEEPMFFRLAPDRRWLAYVQLASRGPFCRTPAADDPEDNYWFDPQGKFMPMYAGRREAYEATDTFTGLGHAS